MTPVITPQVEIKLVDDREVYEPGDVLICEYSVLLHGGTNDETEISRDISAVESSVIWYTDGKGDEDLGVHFFERRKKSTLQPKQLAETHRISTVLPKSPRSYEGEIVQVRWCVRLRIFLAADRQVTKDLPFQLGKTLPVSDLSQETE